jgi:hypothetical protein
MKQKSYRFTTSQFQFNKEAKTFAAESSVLGIFTIEHVHKSILIKSDRTGDVAEFIKECSLIKRDTFMGWIYQPTVESLREYSGLLGYKIHILYS